MALKRIWNLVRDQISTGRRTMGSPVAVRQFFTLEHDPDRALRVAYAPEEARRVGKELIAKAELAEALNRTDIEGRPVPVPVRPVAKEQKGLRRLRLPLKNHDSELIVVSDTFEQARTFVQLEVTREQSHDWTWLQWDEVYDKLADEWHSLDSQRNGEDGK